MTHFEHSNQRKTWNVAYLAMGAVLMVASLVVVML